MRCVSPSTCDFVTVGTLDDEQPDFTIDDHIKHVEPPGSSFNLIPIMRTSPYTFG